VVEGSVAVLLGQVLCRECVDINKLVQHFELVTFDEVFWPWGKAKCNKETFGGSIFHIVFLVFFNEHILQSVPVIVQEARQFCLGFCRFCGSPWSLDPLPDIAPLPPVGCGLLNIVD